MKYYIISGEASGDLHGANLMKALKGLDANAEFRCWGGDLMKKQGGEIVKDYHDLAFMGFVEVLLNLRTILKNIRFCKEDIQKYQPDAVILVDYPGFNLRIAEYVKSLGIPVHYYISPQVWAWKASRVKKIKQFVDALYVILPFEKDFYQQQQYEVQYVGHPLIDALDNFDITPIESDRKIIALLPGSRKQEIAKMLPEMLSVVDDFPDYQFIVAGAPSVSSTFYEQFLKGKQVKIVYNQTYSLLKQAHVALVTSGTATLETALFQVPEVVCYKAGYFSYLLAKNLIKVKHISLVNLVMDKELVKELIQGDLNRKRLISELSLILEEGPARSQMITDYQALKEKLGGGGASQKTAQLIYQALSA